MAHCWKEELRMGLLEWLAVVSFGATIFALIGLST